MDFPQFQDIFAIGAGEILSLNGNLTVESVNRDGSDINVDVAAAAAIGDECIGQLTNVAAANFLDSASGVRLDRLLYDRYGLLRKPAAPGIGSVQFQVLQGGAPVANPTAFAIPINTVVQTINGTQFITTATEVYPLGALGPITVAVQSVLAGAAQQAAIGTITNLVSPIPNGPVSPSSIVINNPLATAGAADEETDPQFRARGRAFFTTARRGTLDAIVQGALAVPGVQSAEAFDLTGATGSPDRYVQLVITDAYTDSLAVLSTVPPAYQAQSQVLSLTVFNALANVRSGGIYVQVTVAQAIMQPALLALSFNASANTLPGGVDGVAQRARAAVVMYTNALPPGATWARAAAQKAVAAVPGLQVTGNEIASPVGDVVPTPLQVIKTSMAIVLASALGVGVVLNANLNPDA